MLCNKNCLLTVSLYDHDISVSCLLLWSCLISGPSFSQVKKTDMDVIRENQQFVWEADDKCDTWDKQLAKKYYDRLYKEYCLADLSRYKENKASAAATTALRIHLYL